ncbi:c-type cytochrome [Nitrosococcus watsonii]|uniref:Cytochrome c class I n=1 Tax=Nitrosococcus watsoni (strain C-113) TaxID=105559 RepID=D8K943_NITWC|nr:c-type cytochrome [Nitrosococcus watsonii]ADJ29186.1 cytochrome c class I [Nitrosococcus watsonii C-113]
MLKKALLTVASAALICSSGLLMAEGDGDAEAGKAYYTQHGCAACHGPKGESVNPAMFPKLAGHDAAYISEQLHAFKSGERKGEGPGAIMNANAAAMSEKNIADVAAFIGSLK